jgi:hypothetical protein
VSSGEFFLRPAEVAVGPIATGRGKLQVQPCPQCPASDVGPKKAACPRAASPIAVLSSASLSMTMVSKSSVGVDRHQAAGGGCRRRASRLGAGGTHGPTPTRGAVKTIASFAASPETACPCRGSGPTGRRTTALNRDVLRPGGFDTPLGAARSRGYGRCGPRLSGGGERSCPALRRLYPLPSVLLGVSKRLSGLPISVKSCGSLSGGSCGTG